MVNRQTIEQSLEIGNTTSIPNSRKTAVSAEHRQRIIEIIQTGLLPGAAAPTAIEQGRGRRRYGRDKNAKATPHIIFG
jgi:hypothetical protein